ncbi:MAG: ABC transporter ATP-binding protein [Betaproteobacteria bacterium]|nr:ABC transporter ATP-binding protein [Betaproteobacteria bacterium]
MSATAILRVAGLSKSWGRLRAVSRVGFELAAGEMLAMIGPNGAGKTTCFNMLNGQIAPDAGRIEFAGHSLAGRAPREIWRLGVGRTFQIAATFASMTLRENVQTALLSRERSLWQFVSLAARRHLAEADALLAQVGLLDQAERPAALLAYGDLKRLELALALAGRPRLLLMDEPTAGMAAKERDALMRRVTDLARESGIAVLFTEHDMDVVFGYADRVLVMHEGELIATGRPAEVRADARVREVYLGSGTDA